MTRRHILILIGILIIAMALRFWQLGNVPPSPDWDEAALGYNAYSLLQTGKDEHGESFPIILQSFGDYKPALYAYLAIPSVAFFGLNTFAIRLPSAIFGVFTVFLVYLLVKELFTTTWKENKKLEIVALLSAALLAISPWHIQFSRVAFESNIGVSLSVLAALFFLYGLRRHAYLIGSAAFFGLLLYAYQSEKVFVPLFFLVLLIVYFKSIILIPKKYLIGATLLGLIIVLPMVYSILTDSNALGRAKGVSILSQQSDEFDKNAKKLITDKKNNDLVGLVLDNRRVLYGKQIVENYISHWDINWLFIKGDISRHHAPGMGLLYLIELPLLLLGIYELLFGRYPRLAKQLLFLWILIAPVAASVTTGVPHAVRSYHMIPVIIILVALGVIRASSLMSRIKRKIFGIKLRYFFISIISLLFLLNFAYYLNQYFVQMNFFYSNAWQYGYEEAVEKTVEFSDNYEKVVIESGGYFDQSYIFYLFFLKYPPEKYQRDVIINDMGRSFDKYEFRRINWEKDKDIKNTLFVGMPDSFPDDSNILHKISYLDGEPAIEIVGTE